MLPVGYVQRCRLKNYKNNPFDFSKDVIPLFLGRIFSYHTNKDFIDIGTPNNLEKAKRIFKTNT